MKDDNIIDWFSLENGTHVPIKKGESKREATSKFLNKKMSRVQKNRDRYDTIERFKKRRATNKFDDNKPTDDKQEPKRKNPNARITAIDKRGNTYIPIREGEEKEYEKSIEQERDEFYNRYANFYGEEYNTRGRQEDGVYYAVSNEEMKNELRSKLDPIYEEKGEITKEDVKNVIENYKKRKATNKQTPTFTGTDIEKLQQEKKYLDKEILDMENANVFSVRDNPGNQKNYLMGDKNFMTLEEKKRYNDMIERRNQILRQLRLNLI